MEPHHDLRRRPVGDTEYSWCRAVPGGTGITVVAASFASSFSPSALFPALQTLVRRHPVLGARLSRPPPPERPFLSFPFQPSSPDNFPAPESSDAADDLHGVVQLELARNPWASTPESGDDWPVFFPAVYSMPDAGRWAIALRVHTVVCDRVSAMQLLQELVAVMGAGSASEELEWEDDAAAGAALEDAIPKRDKEKPIWARGLDLVGYSLNGFRTTTLQFEVPGLARSTEMTRFKLSVEETQHLLQTCTSKGVKLYAAVQAATLIAGHRSNQPPEAAAQQALYSAVTVINCRRNLNPPLTDRNVGFFHSAVTNTHTITGDEGLWELARRCHDAVAGAMSSGKHLRDIGDLNVLMCKAIENPHLTPASSLRTALVSTFLEPAVVESSNEVEDLIGCATVHGVGPSIAVFDVMRGGALDFVAAYPAPLHSRAQIEGILGEVKRMLTENAGAEEDNGALQ